MRTSKFVAFIFSAALAASFARGAFARDGKMPAGDSGRVSEKTFGGGRMDEEKWEKFHDKRMERLSEKLTLSAEQKEKVSKIMQEGRDAVKAEREKMKKRTLEIRNATDAKIEGVLSEEQKTKFRAHKEEMRNKMNKRKGMRGMRSMPEDESPASGTPKK